MSGWNSGRSGAPRRKARSSLIQRRDHGDARCREREEAERHQDERARVGLPALQEAQVVDEHHEAEGSILVQDRDRADVHVTSRQPLHALPGDPRRAGEIGRWAYMCAERRAIEVLGEILGASKRREICSARLGGEDPLVMGDLGEEVLELELPLPVPARDQRLARRAADGELSPQAQIPLEPVLCRPVDDDGRHPGQDAEPENQRDHKADGSAHETSLHHKLVGVQMNRSYSRSEASGGSS
jgi:hypothetical protein